MINDGDDVDEAAAADDDDMSMMILPKHDDVNDQT